MSGVERGYYSDLGAPLLDLCLFGNEGRKIEMPVLIDTGLTCSLLLFEDFSHLASWPVTARADSLSLADGSPRNGYWTGGYIQWFGAATYIDALVIGRPSKARKQPESGFIGMGLLRGLQIRLNPSSMEIVRP